ncbi:hypothetical protein, partial [Parvibaculum sp.]|uniref:hypothetical protein n=1 Tax=Parvibaculum sp. TaxID=2024848 RepID=UPI0038B37169
GIINQHQPPPSFAEKSAGGLERAGRSCELHLFDPAALEIGVSCYRIDKSLRIKRFSGHGPVQCC